MGILQAAPMTLLDTQPKTETAPVEHPVFVAGDGRRARRLRQAALVVGVLATLWLVGLGIGMLGFGNLPGVGLVKGAHADSRTPTPASADPVAQRGNEAQSLQSAGVKAVRRDSSPTAGHARTTSPRAAAKRPALARRAARQTQAPPASTTAQTPANPAQRTRGWARQGYSAPRGQLRKIDPPPPPNTSRGRHIGPTKTTLTPPPPAPGQAKKALEPPPPPPKKG
jgi:hypothetical protein